MRVFFTLFFTLVFSAVLIFLFPEIAINPGKISEGHQHFGKDCLKCHTLLQGATRTKCIDCHESDQIGILTTTGKPIMDNGKVKVAFHQSLTNSDCKSCHILHSVIGQDKEPVKFQHDYLSTTVRMNCVPCHQENRPGDELHRTTRDNCSSCHTTQAWKPSSFDHKKVSSETSCIPCHQKDAPSRDFHSSITDNCVTCHSTKAWEPATLDHKKLSSKANCVPCHQENRPGDELHRTTRDNCSSCHTTQAWKPSTFNHDKYFVFDRNHPSKCVTCHTNPNSYKEYTCYGCHEHSLAKITREHQEEGIYNFEKCTRCHRRGDEE